MTLEALDHLTLPVADLDQAEAFYVTLLGARLIRRIGVTPERHTALQLGDGPELHLFESPGLKRQPPRPHPHIAFRVDHDHLDAFRARLLEAGVKLDGPRRLGGPGHASVYFTDSWGQLLELTALHYRGPVSFGPPDMAKLA